ncbi:hypothetical protein L596_029442 [Steinernema carpocapsae]|uniref:Uncharacterized protein n=1 Tax=Steinernema carpocapsae TaxID=34508 RepID=A0A4U5LUN0_STECR|nr:hypothetical protein L596_029442 [Steinernema carpocapsae]
MWVGLTYSRGGGSADINHGLNIRFALIASAILLVVLYILTGQFYVKTIVTKSCDSLGFLEQLKQSDEDLPQSFNYKIWAWLSGAGRTKNEPKFPNWQVRDNLNRKVEENRAKLKEFAEDGKLDGARMTLAREEVIYAVEHNFSLPEIQNWTEIYIKTLAYDKVCHLEYFISSFVGNGKL